MRIKILLVILSVLLFDLATTIPPGSRDTLSRTAAAVAIGLLVSCFKLEDKDNV